MKYILSKFMIIILIPEIIFVSDYKIGAKMPQKQYYEYEKFKFWAKNGLHFKLRHRKAQKMIYLGDMVTRTGDREVGVVSRRVGMYVYEVDQELGVGNHHLLRDRKWGIDHQKRKKWQIPRRMLGGGMHGNRSNWTMYYSRTVLNWGLRLFE